MKKPKEYITWGIGSQSSSTGGATDILGKSLLFLDPTVQVDLSEYGLRSIVGLLTTLNCIFFSEFL